MLTDAIIDKPKRVASRLGTFGQVLYAVSPKSVDRIMNQAYKIFPDSKAAKGEKDKKDDSSSKDGDGGGKKKDGEMSTEAIAMAYLMKGVHF
jgi:hypothetical protein